jgi:hypothetical protein
LLLLVAVIVYSEVQVRSQSNDLIIEVYLS